MTPKQALALQKHIAALAPKGIAELEAIAFGDYRPSDRLAALKLLSTLGNWGKTKQPASEREASERSATIHQERVASEFALSEELDRRQEARRLEFLYERPDSDSD